MYNDAIYCYPGHTLTLGTIDCGVRVITGCRSIATRNALSHFRLVGPTVTLLPIFFTIIIIQNVTLNKWVSTFKKYYATKLH